MDNGKRGGYILIDDIITFDGEDYSISENEVNITIFGDGGTTIENVESLVYVNIYGEKQHMYFIPYNSRYEMYWVYADFKGLCEDDSGNTISVLLGEYTIDNIDTMDMFLSNSYLSYKNILSGFTGEWWKNEQFNSLSERDKWAIKHAIFRQTDNDSDGFNSNVYGTEEGIDIPVILFGQPEGINSVFSATTGNIKNTTQYREYQGFNLTDTSSIIPTENYSAITREPFQKMTYNGLRICSEVLMDVNVVGMSYSDDKTVITVNGGLEAGNAYILTTPDENMYFAVAKTATEFEGIDGDLKPEVDDETLLTATNGYYANITVHKTLKYPVVYKPFYGDITIFTWSERKLRNKVGADNQITPELWYESGKYKIGGRLYNGITYNNSFGNANFSGDCTVNEINIPFDNTITANTNEDTVEGFRTVNIPANHNIEPYFSETYSSDTFSYLFTEGYPETIRNSGTTTDDNNFFQKINYPTPIALSTVSDNITGVFYDNIAYNPIRQAFEGYVESERTLTNGAKYYLIRKPNVNLFSSARTACVKDANNDKYWVACRYNENMKYPIEKTGDVTIAEYKNGQLLYKYKSTSASTSPIIEKSVNTGSYGDIETLSTGITQFIENTLKHSGLSPVIEYRYDSANTNDMVSEYESGISGGTEIVIGNSSYAFNPTNMTVVGVYEKQGVKGSTKLIKLYPVIENAVNYEVTGETPYIRITMGGQSGEIEINDLEDIYKLDIDTNMGEWRISTAASENNWFIVSPITGNGVGSISVTTKHNQSGENKRLTITASTVNGEVLSSTITLVQKYESIYITVQDVAPTMEAKGGVITLSVSANSSWHATWSSTIPSEWTISALSGPSGETRISITMGENSTDNQIIRTLTFTTDKDGKQTQATITQFSVNSSEPIFFTVERPTQNVTVGINAGSIAYKIVASESVSWTGSCNNTSLVPRTITGTGSRSGSIQYNENTGGNERSGIYTFTADNNLGSRSFEITQKAFVFDVLSPSTEANNPTIVTNYVEEGDNRVALTISASTGIIWTATSNSDFIVFDLGEEGTIQEVTGNGSYNTTIINVLNNDGGERTGTISIEASNIATVICYIKQGRGNGEISWEPNIYDKMIVATAGTYDRNYLDEIGSDHVGYYDNNDVPLSFSNGNPLKTVEGNTCDLGTIYYFYLHSADPDAEESQWAIFTERYELRDITFSEE